MSPIYRRVFILTLLLGSFVIHTEAQSAIGISAGINNMKFTGDQPTTGWIGIDKGYLVGLNYTYRFNQMFSLATGVNYGQSKSKYIHADTLDLNLDSLDLKFSGLIVPLDFTVWSENGRFYVVAGVEFFHNTKFTGVNRFGEEINFKDEIRNITISAHFGAGFIIPIGKPHLFFDARYSQGLTDLNNALHKSQESYLPRTKIFSVKLKMGIVLPIGKSNYYKISKAI